VAWQKWSGNGPASPGQQRSGSFGGRFGISGAQWPVGYDAGAARL